MEMVAIRSFPFRGKILQKGDQFDASHKDGRILEMTKRAKRVLPVETKEPEPKAEVYETRVMVAEKPVNTAPRKRGRPKKVASK